MHLVVLAAGFATRLYPLTRNQAKPLLKVGGKPVLEWLLDAALYIPSIRSCTLVSNARFATDFEAFARGYSGRVPIQVLNDGATEEHGKRGAVGDLALALQSIPAGEPLLVAAGDNLIDFSLLPYAQAFTGCDDRPLLLVRQISAPVPPGRYSEVVLEPDHTGGIYPVRSFREKPQDPNSDLSAVGLYFLPGDVRSDVQKYLADDGEPDAPGHFFQALCQWRPMGAKLIEGGWHDIGNHETLAQARDAFSTQ